MRPRPEKRSAAKVDARTKYASYNSKADPIDQKKKKFKVKHLGTRLKDDNDPGVIDVNTPNEYMEARVAFCCYQCSCPDDIKDQIPDDDPFIQSSEEGLYHRRCCHKVFEPDENWTSPFEHAAEEVLLQEEEEVCHYVMTPQELQEQYRNAIMHQNASYNADGQPGMSTHVGFSCPCLLLHNSLSNVLCLLHVSKEFASLLQTSADYVENQKQFFRIPRKIGEDDALCVLVGATLLSWKKYYTLSFTANTMQYGIKYNYALFDLYRICLRVLELVS
jgi:hypothetical protein